MDEQNKALKRQCNILGGALLIYKVIMNVAVFVVMLGAALVMAILAVMGTAFESFTNEGLLPEDAVLDMSQMVADAMTKSMGWGYLLAVLIGFLILLLWKKPSYLKSLVAQRGRSMKVGTFFLLLGLCVSCQVAIQAVCTLAEAVYNPFGFSLVGLMESAGASTDDLAMLLYIGIAAPITEELLFRGVLINDLQPHGKGIAILVSAFLFGFFHGSPVQTPFAIFMGLLLGYVAVEYNIWWAIVLHIFNNLILGDVLPRVLAYLPAELPNIVMNVLMIGSAVAVAIVAWVQRNRIPAVLNVFHSENAQWRSVTSSPCIVILFAISLFDMAAMAFLLVFANS